MENVRLLTNQNPFASAQQPTILAPQLGGSDDWYGACSIETFLPGVGNLFATHEDAEGFLDYPTKFRPANFWYKDASVQSWMYGETYDNYLDTYGADAVTAFYHSGHGGMDNNGVFFMPMGAAWGNESWANSNQMALGNEQVRYLFFSTCLSLRVLDGHSPIRTWWNRCLGFRMLFGFETVSVDNPNYGKFFWEEWNKNKSFSQAWLDASWRISHGQAPSVVAVGANQTDAVNRLNQERFFSRDAVARNWFQWRWYNAVRAAGTVQAASRIPEKLSRLEFAPMIQRTENVQAMAYELGFTRESFNNVGIDPVGNLIVESEGRRAFIGSDGRREFVLRPVNIENRSAIDPEKAVQIAEKAIQDLNIGNRQHLTVDTYRIGYTCGGTQEGSGTLDKEYATDVTIMFRPVVEGISNVNHDHGNLNITVDNDGNITTIRDTTRQVENVREAKLFSGPRAKKPTTDVEKLLKDASKGRYGKNRVTLLTDTVRVGYDYSGKSGNLVAQGTFEVDFGQNIRKQFITRVPIPVV